MPQAKLKTLAATTVTTAGTRVQLTATAIPAYAVVITADPANTGTVYIGDVSVASTNGEPLTASQSITISGPEVRGTDFAVLLSDIYVDSSANGNKVRTQYLSWS